jgi:coatomer subunit beta'
MCPVKMSHDLSYSQVPKAVDAWRGGLQTKNRPKIAAGIVHPDEHADLFEEGWQRALEKESKAVSAAPVINGRNLD